jgi:hypothetical protein
MDDTTDATKHAVRQILFRLRYMLCIDTAAAFMATTKYTKWHYQRHHKGRVLESDSSIVEENLVNAIQDMLVPDKVRSGVQPRQSIFNRPVILLRRRHNDDHDHHNDKQYATITGLLTAKNRNEKGHHNDDVTDIDNHGQELQEQSKYYNSAIQAAYDFSYQSTKVRHLNETTIDDIAIGTLLSVFQFFLFIQ